MIEHESILWKPNIIFLMKSYISQNFECPNTNFDELQPDEELPTLSGHFFMIIFPTHLQRNLA